MASAQIRRSVLEDRRRCNARKRLMVTEKDSPLQMMCFLTEGSPQTYDRASNGGQSSRTCSMRLAERGAESGPGRIWRSRRFRFCNLRGYNDVVIFHSILLEMCPNLASSANLCSNWRRGSIVGRLAPDSSPETRGLGSHWLRIASQPGL